jgi:hypothetical protein
MPLEGKKRFMNPWKVNYSPSRKDQNRIRNARNTCFKRWKYGEIGGYNVTDSTNTKPTAVILWVYLKEGRQVHLHQRYGDFKHIGHRLKLKKDT